MGDLQIELDGIIIQIIRKPIKHMHLRIYPPEGDVRVSAPLRLSMNHIRTQIEEKRDWIHTQRAKLRKQPLKSQQVLQTGETHFFLGQAYDLLIDHSLESTSPYIRDNQLIFSAKPDASFLDKQLILKRWHQQEMRRLVPDLIEKWQQVIGVTSSSWGARTMKTRWGSCNIRTRKISLNLILIQKSIACLEYVIVHELVHLLEASHNARFHQLMDRFMPDWKSHKQLLL